MIDGRLFVCVISLSYNPRSVGAFVDDNLPERKDKDRDG